MDANTCFKTVKHAKICNFKLIFSKYSKISIMLPLITVFPSLLLTYGQALDESSCARRDFVCECV